MSGISGVHSIVHTKKIFVLELWFSSSVQPASRLGNFTESGKKEMLVNIPKGRKGQDITNFSNR